MTPPRFSEEIILSVAKTTLTNARNNLAALAELGITAEMLNRFDSDIQAAESLPRETQNRIELRELTGGKAEAMAACRQWGRKLKTRLELAFGKNSSQLNAFPAKEFASAAHSEDAMMSVMEILISLADKYKTELACVGQTPEILSQGSQLLQDLRTADAAQELKKDEKKGATRERRQKFQVIYDTVNKVNKAGRLVFENDPAHLALFESKWPASGQQAVAAETV